VQLARRPEEPVAANVASTTIESAAPLLSASLSTVVPLARERRDVAPAAPELDGERTGS
jgi:hypothetical protein